jgi:hypothetical protein
MTATCTCPCPHPKPHQEPWYVWIVGRYHDDVEENTTGPWSIVGIFTTRDAAREAGSPGDWIGTIPLNEPATLGLTLNAEWIEEDG